MDIARDIPLAEVQPAPVLLRPIDKLSMAYLSMVEEFREDGHLLNAILVRPMEAGFQVVDGMYRWTAAHEAPLEMIQCVVREMTDEEVVVYQIRANSGRKGTDPIEYARHLERLRRLHGDACTLVKLADLVGRPRDWVCEMFSLNKLIGPAKKAVQRGEISVGNAKLLAKLKRHLQPAHLRDARLMKVGEFRQVIAGAVNDYREAIKKGRMDAYFGGEARPRCRRITEITDELDNWATGGLMMLKHGCQTPLDGWKLAIQWVMSSDPDSIAARHARVQREELARLEQQKERKEQREKRRLDNDPDL